VSVNRARVWRCRVRMCLWCVSIEHAHPNTNSVVLRDPCREKMSSAACAYMRACEHVRVCCVTVCARHTHTSFASTVLPPKHTHIQTHRETPRHTTQGHTHTHTTYTHTQHTHTHNSQQTHNSHIHQTRYARTHGCSAHTRHPKTRTRAHPTHTRTHTHMCTQTHTHTHMNRLQKTLNSQRDALYVVIDL